MRWILVCLLAMFGSMKAASAAECRPAQRSLAPDTTGSAVMLSSLCSLGAGSDRKLRLTWLRLTEGLAGSIIGKQDLPELSRVIGGHIRVVDNEVLSGATDLFNRFGLRQSFYDFGSNPSFESESSWTLTVNGITVGNDSFSKVAPIRNAKPTRRVWSLTQSLTGYAELAYGPAFQSVLRTRGWPSGFNQFLRCPAPEVGGGDPDFVKCMYLWKYLSPADLDPLAQEIREAARRARADRRAVRSVLEPQYQRHFRLFRYLVGQSWPANFLTVGINVGLEGCDSDGYWTFDYSPPRFALDLLLLENEGAAPVRLDDIRGLREPGTLLAPLGPGTSVPPETTSLSQTVTLAPGERMAIPTRAFFLGGVRSVENEEVEPDAGTRPDDVGRADRGGLESGLIAFRRLQQVSKPTVEAVIELDSRQVKIRKDVAAFVRPKLPESVDYRFGPSLVPQELVIDGSTIPLSTPGPGETNDLELRYVDRLGGASCPILYVWDPDAKDWVRIGKVLHVAQGEDKLTTQRIPLPSLVDRIRLAEEEPERTVVKALRLEVATRDGRMFTVSPTEPVAAPIEAYEFADIRFDVPDEIAGAEIAKVELVIEGYYERYSSLLARR